MTSDVAAISWRKENRRGWSCSTNETDSGPVPGAHRVEHWQPAHDLPAAAARDPDEFLHLQQPPLCPCRRHRPDVIKRPVTVRLDKCAVSRSYRHRCHGGLRRVPIGETQSGETLAPGV